MKIKDFFNCFSVKAVEYECWMMLKVAANYTVCELYGLDQTFIVYAYNKIEFVCQKLVFCLQRILYCVISVG